MPHDDGDLFSVFASEQYRVCLKLPALCCQFEPAQELTDADYIVETLSIEKMLALLQLSIIPAC